MKTTIVGILLLSFLFVVFMPPQKISYAAIPTLNDKISSIAFKYHVPEKTMFKIISCESSFNPNNHTQSSRENSWGLVQINLKAHPEITQEEAVNPDFALNYLAKNLAKGNGGMWTCYWLTKDRKV